MPAKNLIKERIGILCDFGLTDKPKLKTYLTAQTANITSDYKKEITLEHISRTLIENYFNGDRTYVKVK